MASARATRDKPKPSTSGRRAAKPRSPEPSGTDIDPSVVGERLRVERTQRGIGLRELSRRLGVSASLISQIERGHSMPSVGTLYAIVNELDLSLDELFSNSLDPATGKRNGRSEPTPPPRVPDASHGEGADELPATPDGPAPAARPTAPVLTRRGPERADAVHAAAPRQRPEAGPVVAAEARTAIQLGSGVRWERLTPETDHDVDFLHVIYDVGGASCDPDMLMRHPGKEYGLVLEGRLGVTVGFDSYELGPGDSISFDSTVPHRLWTIGDEPAQGIWFVIGRSGH